MSEKQFHRQALALAASNYHALVSHCGGRLLSFRHADMPCPDDKPALLEEGLQFGCTVWTAPQADWGWPPPVALDSERYELVEQSNSTLTLKSVRKNGYPWQLEKSFYLDDQGLRMTYILANVSNQSQKAALWEVSRHSGAPVIFSKPQNTDQLTREHGSVLKFGEALAHYQYAPRLGDSSHKLFVHGASTWLAQLFENGMLVKEFPVLDSKAAAPGEAGLEIYGHGYEHEPYEGYIELEQQGAYQSVDVGESIEYETHWKLVPVDPSPMSELLKMLSQNGAIEEEPGGARVGKSKARSDLKSFEAMFFERFPSLA